MKIKDSLFTTALILGLVFFNLTSAFIVIYWAIRKDQIITPITPSDDFLKFVSWLLVLIFYILTLYIFYAIGEHDGENKNKKI